MNRLTKAEITRLARRAGVSRLSGLAFEEMRGVLGMFLEKILSGASAFTRTYITTEHIMMVLPQGAYTDEMQDVPCLYFKSKKFYKRKGSRAWDEIRAYQKTTCLLTGDVPWRQAADHIIGEGIIDKDAYHMLHVLGENYAIHLFRDALLLAIYAKRVTVMPKDINMARCVQENSSYVMRAARVLPKVDFRDSIRGVLGQIYKDLDINADALGQLNFFVNVLAENLAQRTAALLAVSNKTTLGSEDVEMAVSGLLQSGLAHASKSEINYRIQSLPGVFNQADAVPFLLHCTDHAKMLGCLNVDIESNAQSAFVAVLEYLCAEILAQSGNAALDSNADAIDARSLKLVINGDEELLELFKALGITIAGGGVSPNIHSRLLPLRRQQDQEAQEAV